MPSRDAPRPDEETPRRVDPALLADLEEALRERFSAALREGERLLVDARVGERAAWLAAALADERRGLEIELFAREIDGEGLEGALGLLIDYLVGVLEELFAADRDAWLPLDFEGRPFEAHVVFARGEARDYLAEEQGARLLDEEPRPPLVKGRAHRTSA